jgi:hypothetical protein
MFMEMGGHTFAERMGLVAAAVHRRTLIVRFTGCLLGHLPGDWGRSVTVPTTATNYRFQRGVSRSQFQGI